jgi:serine/threonine protein phosphatase PrpC
MNVYKSFAATVTGISHTKHGKGCEDCSAHYDNPVLSIAAVADGHGDDNCFRSAQGAKLATKCAVKGIYDFVYPEHAHKLGKLTIKKSHQLRQIPEVGESEKKLRDLVKHIVMAWHTSVEQDYTQNPISPAELEKAEEKYKKRYASGEKLHHAYGTTLIAAAITYDYWFGIHIGDGRLTALYADGTFDQPVPWDERCYLNVTTSICDDDAADTARIYFSFNAQKAPPLAIFLCSDGVDDNYPVQDNDKHLFKLYRTITQSFAEESAEAGKEGFESMCGKDGNGGQIKDLCTSFATKGKGDDTSIAGIIDMSMVGEPEIAQIYEKQIAEETGGTVTPPDKKTNIKNTHLSDAETEKLVPEISIKDKI